MNYTVEWSDIAGNELAEIWFDNPADQSAITISAGILNELLKHDGPTVGESRQGNRRVAFERPIGVYFHFANGVVEILHVWFYRGKAPQK